MLASTAKPVFVAACAANLVFSVLGAFAIEGYRPAVDGFALLGGGFAFLVAAVTALIILRDRDGMDRPWIKAALVFLVLGPLAFWGLQWPAAEAAACIDGCISRETIASHLRTIGDVIQSQIAMIVVAGAAVFCAARAMSVTLDELAV